jgi:hypothetical protein
MIRLESNVYKPDLNIRVNNITVDGEINATSVNYPKIELDGFILGGGTRLIPEDIAIKGELSRVDDQVTLQLPAVTIVSAEQNDESGVTMIIEYPVADKIQIPFNDRKFHYPVTIIDSTTGKPNPARILLEFTSTGGDNPLVSNIILIFERSVISSGDVTLTDSFTGQAGHSFSYAGDQLLTFPARVLDKLLVD